MINERSVNYHPSHSSLSSGTHPPISLQVSYFAYPIMFEESFKIYGVQITGKYISKLQITRALLLQTKLSLRFLHHPLGRGKSLITPKVAFFQKSISSQ